MVITTLQNISINFVLYSFWSARKSALLYDNKYELAEEKGSIFVIFHANVAEKLPPSYQLSFSPQSAETSERIGCHP